MHRDWWLPLANLCLNFEFDLLILTGTHWRGALRDRFVGYVPPLQRHTGGVLLENVLWDTCPPCSCGSWFLILVIEYFGFLVLIAAGPMNVAAGLDYGISFLDHIHSWKGYVPVALWPVYPLLPRGVPY